MIAAGGVTVQTLSRDPLVARAIEYTAETIEIRAQVEALTDGAFGPGRFAKTAERLREGNALRLDLSLCAWADGAMIGTVRMWPVRIGATPAIFLGPIAVDAGWRKHGVGAALVSRACAAALKAGERIVILVGDRPFFGPLGFEPTLATVRLPGPVDVGRVLWRALDQAALHGVSGLVTVQTLPVGGERA